MAFKNPVTALARITLGMGTTDVQCGGQAPANQK